MQRGEFGKDDNEYSVDDPTNSTWLYADFYDGSTLCEVKTYKKRNNAVGQILNYKSRLLAEGRPVSKMRIHLFDVVVQQGVEEFRSICEPLGIEVTQEPSDSKFAVFQH